MSLVNAMPDNTGTSERMENFNRWKRDGKKSSLVQFTKSIELDLMFSAYRAFKGQLPNNYCL